MMQDGKRYDYVEGAYIVHSIRRNGANSKGAPITVASACGFDIIRFGIEAMIVNISWEVSQDVRRSTADVEHALRRLNSQKLIPDT